MNEKIEVVDKLITKILGRENQSEPACYDDLAAFFAVITNYWPGFKQAIVGKQKHYRQCDKQNGAPKNTK